MNPANDNGLGVPPGVYSMVEAAAYLKISRRKLQDLISVHPYYASNGNRKRFSQTHINQLWNAICHSTPTSPLGERTGTYEASTTLETMFSSHSKRKTKR